MASLPLEGIYPQIKRAKVLFKTKTYDIPSICNSIFHTAVNHIVGAKEVVLRGGPPSVEGEQSNRKVNLINSDNHQITSGKHRVTGM